MKTTYPLTCISFLLLPFLGVTQTNTFPATGNVGIGTTSPVTKLDIIKDPNNRYISVYRDALPGNDSYIYHAITPNYHLIGSSKNGTGLLRKIGFAVGLTDTESDVRMTIDNLGNVGIGTTAPAVKLDVAGYTRAQRFTLKDNWDNVIESEDNGNTYQLIGTYRGWDPKAVYISAYNVGNHTAYATERVFIGQPGFNNKYLTVNFLNGGVGIGTTNTADPNYQLFVEKGIRTRKVKVDQASWADYVFEPSYKLPTLQEVETFIKLNKHLPDVPSAKEVEANGLDLGDNQAVLLKKIEEQMLYILELNRRIEKLEVINQQLLLERTTTKAK